MKKINKHIEIVRYASTHISTSMGAKSSEAILDVLSKHYTRVGISVVKDLSDLKAAVEAKPDLVFLGKKFIPMDQALGLDDPDKIWIAQYLDDNNIAYTGSDHLAHQLEINKPLAKRCLLAAGLKTSPFYVAPKTSTLVKPSVDLKFPLFVKPTSSGGGQGIDSDSVVRNIKQLNAKVKSIAESLGSDSLVEEYLPGREFSVAILKHGCLQTYMTMAIEIIAPADEHGSRVLSSQIKKADTERSLKVIDQTIEAKINNLALSAFHALGARDYGRIDIRLDSAGVPHFLEANLAPSLKRSVGNYFPKACLLNLGLDYEAMILAIAELGLSRSAAMPLDAVEPDINLSTFLEPVIV